MAQRLGATFHPIPSFSWRRRAYLAPAKYAVQHAKTIRALSERRPAAVYVIIPPTFAALSVYTYCRSAGIPFVMDVHGHSLTSKKWAWTAPLQKFLAKRALATVVDQRMYQQTFDSAGARTIVLERAPLGVAKDSLPETATSDRFTVTMVCIFASDEPVDVVVQAARQLPRVQFAITGDTANAPRGLVEGAPANVTFTGYLKGNAYWQQLHTSRAVMTLTTEPYSLLSGGVESMALGKPTIVSRTPLLQEYFTKGTVFVEHTTESIAASVRAVQEQEQQLIAEISQLAYEKRTRWENSLCELKDLIAKTSQPAPLTTQNGVHPRSTL
jgi:glycosyltransferase involved in cell wall biosynthesis